MFCTLKKSNHPASARTVLYEGFDYPAGEFDGSQTGGTGFADKGWTTSGINPFAITTPGLSVPGVSGMGGAVQRPSPPGGAEMHREITPVSQRTLTAEGRTVWFSALLRTDAHSTGNANMTMILGTGPILENATTQPVVLSGGEGIGVAINGGKDGMAIHGYASEGGSAAYSKGFLPDANGADNTGVVEMVAGKIEWAAEGDKDSLHLFHIDDPTAPEPENADAFASMTADLDQSRFDTIAIGTQQIALLDEIRFGTDYSSVTGVMMPSPPTPADGTILPAGEIELGWTNLPAENGSDVPVDVWFGTDPDKLTQVLNAGSNTTSHTVKAPSAAIFYWRVDSYPDGNANGTPIIGSRYSFVVNDSDADGMPDAFELKHTDPPSGTALDPSADLDSDGLTNLQEYTYGTDPNNPDSDGDTLEDGAEVAGAGQRPATSPIERDTDRDGLDDQIESNTGTWVNANDTGTNPADPDSDGDGYSDSAETNSGSYVDANNTGTNPNKADTDGDGAGDWYEISASFTDATDASDKPVIPYPLPDPDPSDKGAADKPVKVYILSGQSNMVGFGQVTGSDPGTLETITAANRFPNLVDENGDWTVANDVHYRGVVSDIGKGPLQAMVGGDKYGPELGFGSVMGWYHDEPVLLIKSSIGNRGIGWDILPPGSERFTAEREDGDYIYAGYGDPSGFWKVGTEPEIGPWYAGKSYDSFFHDEADMGPKLSWSPGTLYPRRCYIHYQGASYRNKDAHSSDAASEPGVGENWKDFWELRTETNVVDVLDNFASEYPQWAAQGFEIAGYVWWQGHWDGGQSGTGTAGVYAQRYEQNLVQLINSLRDYYESRYPENTVPDAPFVVATVGFDGGDWEPGSSADTIFKAQMAVSDDAAHPAFAGNVGAFDSTGYWRTAEESPKGQGYHYNWNAETYLLVGDAAGRKMLDLLPATPPPQK